MPEGGTDFVLSAAGQPVTYGEPALLLQSLVIDQERPPLPFLDLEVHYVGMAKGVKREACAVDRLTGGHKKYEAVLHHLYDTNVHRNRDCWFVLAGGNTVNYMLNGAIELPEYVKERMNDKARSTLNDKRRIEVLEALMINYFQPAFNDTNKVLLEPRIAKWMQETGVAQFLLSMWTYELGARLYSSAVEPRLSHARVFCASDDSVAI